MTTQALAMPQYVADLVKLQLNRMGLTHIDAKDDDVIFCPLSYEDGSELSLVVMCIAQRGWLREKPVLLVSIVELGQDTNILRVHFRETMRVPKGPHDFFFLMELMAKIKATAWAIAATAGMGECVSLPGRPPAAKGS